MSSRILVVDDENEIRTLFKMVLIREGFDVDVVSSGKEALEAINNHEYSLVFLDLNMPEMNGVDTLIQIRQVSKDLPVYIITGFYAQYMEVLKPLVSDGINFEVLEKPVDWRNLTALAANLA